MFRSGSTLQYQLTAHLVEDAGLGRRVEWVRPEEFDELRDRWDHYSGWKVFKVHRMTDAVRSELDRGTTKCIYTYRDLRDVLVSQHYKSGASYETLLESGFLRTCVREYHSWTSNPNVLVSRYEDLVGNLAGEVGRIAKHLGIACSEVDQQTIADFYSLEQQKKRLTKVKRRLVPTSEDRDGIAIDRHSQLHENHIRGASATSWREELTTGQVWEIEKHFGDWLCARGYRLTSRKRRLSYWLRSKCGCLSPD